MHHSIIREQNLVLGFLSHKGNSCGRRYLNLILMFKYMQVCIHTHTCGLIDIICIYISVCESVLCMVSRDT